MPEPVETPTEETPAVIETAAKKGPGRPRNDGLSPGTAGKETRVPRPRYQNYRSDAEHKNQQPSSGFQYLREMPEWAKAKITLYVYREHPVLRLRDDDTEHEPGSNPNIDKIAGETGIEGIDDICNRYGCGDYHIRVNSADEKQTICFIRMKGVGGGDYRSHPPTDARVNDIEQVDLGHPANAAYVSYLRGRGVLPEQGRKAEKEAEVATIQLAERAMDRADKLTDKLLQGRTERPDPSGDAIKNALDTQAHAARLNSEMMQATFQSLLENIKNLQGGGGNGEVIALMMQLMSKMTEMSGGGQTPAMQAELASLRAQVQTMYEARLQSMERLLETAQQRTIPAPATNSIKDSVEALRSMREVVDEFTGEKRNPVTEAAEDLAPRWLRPFISLMPLAQTALQAFIMAKMSNGAGVPAGFPVPRTAPNPQQTSLPAPEPTEETQIMQLLSAIAYPLQSKLLDPEFPGDEFAQWLADGYGTITCQQITSCGEEKILAAIYSHPELAPALRTIPQPRVQAFVSQFCQAKFEEQPVA